MRRSIWLESTAQSGRFLRRVSKDDWRLKYTEVKSQQRAFTQRPSLSNNPRILNNYLIFSTVSKYDLVTKNLENAKIHNTTKNIHCQLMPGGLKCLAVRNIWGLQYIGARLQYIGAPKFYFQHFGREWREKVMIKPGFVCHMRVYQMDWEPLV